MTLSLLSLAVDPSDLHPVESLSITGPLIAAIVVFLLLAVVLVIVAVILSRPARASRAAAQLRGAHRNASAKAQWHARIDDVLDRYANGTLTREDAFVELALIAREFATAASGKPLKSSTLADLTRIDRTLVNRQGLDTLRQTIEALYPPEFANPAFNYQAQTVTVDQAAEWVANLVERWRA
ncbi:hypothetical protein BLI708_07235 [Bifidobacterium imperatoris]|uniref:Uncharacterized protein n=1 Tax=Bifidobacterium imperatoris TaxID=2020965 RepID=A0A2N5IU19_9BIFI|nr:hypothetical protein [Bifidobacterium imperatoris]PLS25473.1 hypothetical protein Tam1G_0297 [Bifidobacterium imperatoris]QSY57053.1 hypothetical protein BLI708_07235 [Bifidobacterium imperatoris]